MIEPRVVKGFRDTLPQDEYLRSQVIQKLAGAFYLQGYQPIDTPILEYTETLLGKSGGETEKQIFRFRDAGERDVAMRFDLTVPMARYIAMHKEEIGLPFKRYHIAKVWRGEKPQRGRFREFYQCDFDLVGSSSPVSDLDILLTAYTSLQNLGIINFTIEVNHRGILREYLEKLGIVEHTVLILRTIDKIDKIGKDAVRSELSQELSDDIVEQLYAFLFPLDETRTFEHMTDLLGSNSTSIIHMQWLFDAVKGLGLTHIFQFNPKITRGLDYYTGMVFETFLTDDRTLGSICSGGRYDNLLALYGKESISGVGGSIGLDRLLTSERCLQLLNIPRPLKVFIYHNTESHARSYSLIQALQGSGVVAEMYPDAKKIDNQTKYAIRQGFELAIFIEGDGYTLRDLIRKESIKDLSLEMVLATLKERYLG
ncbi:histidine--tRNA ligase [Entomospira entomophila]|uniref:Histidine--tRNA ligase n=1 Tax=Entomospira entomophila TaxID=2719988 RepID=A0A968G9X9_9SPIO|nr:histidine--tRNA ligase [Entomospira entomophilus]NIZ40612.1 histidine--tRNA ligase [Entomospira entomophilus]WDI34827.1 histidine--tRNA ligase [Entomospira entomophilus]